MKYPDKSKELINLLSIDQSEWKAYVKAEYIDKSLAEELRKLKVTLRKNVALRGERALEILNEIKSIPSLDAIGKQAAIALSVLATHYSLSATKQVLAAFESCYEQSPQNIQLASIPAMTDWIAVLEHRPQKFGTIWLFDSNNYPFLPIVEDFEDINERRNKYEIEPLRWPKSLVLAAENQPWLNRPISEINMRPPTKNELRTLSEFYI